MPLIKSINKIGIIGSGKMGSDIFYFLLDYEFEIVWICIDTEEAIANQQSFLKKITRLHKCGLIDDFRFQKVQTSVVISSSIENLSSCNLIIECILENLADKKQLFENIEPFINDKCIIASNSSSISPSLLITNPKLIDRFIGLHFFYPLKLKNIVELIKTQHTSHELISKIIEFCNFIGKSIIIQDEENAFILNKLFLEVQNEAYLIYTEGNLSYKQIDEIVDKHLFPGGIFKFFDQVGNDVMLESIKNYISDTYNRLPYQALINKLEELCSRNLLGIKTKAGFYSYNSEAMDEITDNNNYPEEYCNKALIRLKKVYIQKAEQLVKDGICDKETLEFAAKEYMNADKGPFAIALET